MRNQKQLTWRFSYDKFPVLLFIMLMLFASCSSTPKVSNMIPPGIEIQNPSSKSVYVDEKKKVTVSRNDHGLGSKIPNKDFLEAVRASIEASNLFSNVVQTDQADYHLLVTLIDVEFGLDDHFVGWVLSYTITAEWELLDAMTSKRVFHEYISTPGNANMNDAFNGITRNTIARERAVRANIEEGIRQLSLSDL